MEQFNNNSPPGTEMLTCVPPYLSQSLVVHLMKNYIKAFVATGLGLAMINLVAQTDSDRVSDGVCCFTI